MMDLKNFHRNSSRGYDRFGRSASSGEQVASVRAIGFGGNARQPISRVVRSVRRKCRAGTSTRQLVSREKEANRREPRCSSRNNLTLAVIVGIAVLTCQYVESYLRAVGRCATCAMGMMGMFKWLRKDPIQRERDRWNLAQKQCGLNNESYRNALQAFIDRRRFLDDTETDTPCSPDKTRADFLAKNVNTKCDNERKSQESKSIVPGVPHIPAPEIFEIGWVAGTEDRYLELIFAEWQNTRVSLKRHIHPECKDAVKADLDVLSEIRHPNVLLLMATTHTDDHGLVSIFESVDCTLYHYIHDQGERISIQGIAKCGGRLSDALRHSHMRGYVHTAISSHCVYLASSGIVKLGGWELAMCINSPKPDRAYEERLRTEIFRWQAPELFHSCEPRKESDVYGLTMLIWEMCTMHVPWSGYSKADVERQYTHWKRGVIMDLYNFPPLLNNLLEAGLQLDVNKRTLDMNRMRRFLQRLEMQYEEEEPVYIDQYTNNNNESGNTYILHMKPSIVSKSKGGKLTKSISAKQLYSATASDSPTRHFLYPRKVTSKQNGNLKAMAHIEQINLFTENVKRHSKDDVQKKSNVFCNVQNNYKKSNYSNCNLETSDTFQTEEGNSEEIVQPWNSSYKKVKAPQEIVESRTTSVYSSPLIDSTDDESFKDARTNLKQLKKALADKREHFFCGSESSHVSADTSPESKNQILAQTKSKDYEPHKPASHKTSLEPKCSKSPSQYDPSCMKSSFQQRKIPYLHTPESIKDAIIQPQVLNSDPQSFFETSLWRKEKLICLSKMRKAYDDESTQAQDFVQHTDDNDTGSITTITKNQTTEMDSLKSNNTYIINRKPKATEMETSQEVMQNSENVSDSMETIDPQSKPLQVLKDALDRATKIVRSVTPNSDQSYSSSPFKTSIDFEIAANDNQAAKCIFEDLHNLQSNDEEIKSIERSTMKDKTFLFYKNDVDSTINSSQTQKKSDNDTTVSITSNENPTLLYDTTFTKHFVCESIAEVSSEFNSSYNDSKLGKVELLSNTETTSEEKENFSESVQNTNTMTKKSNIEPKVKTEEEEKTSKFNFIFLNEASKVKNCKSCHQSTLPRRRSLPAALSQLRGMNNSTLGKLPIRRGDIPDNTIEDLYIDDEFGDNLNVNMILLDEDLSVDEDFLTDVSEI